MPGVGNADLIARQGREIEDGWYMAVVLDYPGVVSQGKTLKSARRMIRDALRLVATVDFEDRRPLPKPNPRANDKSAVFQESIPLKAQVTTGGLRETA